MTSATGSRPRSTSCSRPRASPGRTATRASGSRSRAASSSAAACCRPTSTPRRRSSSRRGRCRRPPPAHLEQGLHLVASRVRRDPENPLSALKTTSRADYVYARVEARTAGADDALFLTIDGFLSEATSANVFLVRGGELATPSLACAILPGTTRSWILRWADGVGPAPRRGLLTRATSPTPTRRSSRAASPGSCPSPASRAPRSATAGPANGRCAPAPTARRSWAGRKSVDFLGAKQRAAPATRARDVTDLAYGWLVRRHSRQRPAHEAGLRPFTEGAHTCSRIVRTRAAFAASMVSDDGRAPSFMMTRPAAECRIASASEVGPVS